MDSFEVREAVPADADAVAAYHQRWFSETYAPQLLAGQLDAPDDAGMRRQLHEWFMPGSGVQTRLATSVDGTPIGHVSVCGHQLLHLFADLDHQGMGLGGHLLALGESMIAAAGHTNFELHSRVDNVSAVGFYEKAGWVVTDRLIHTVEHGISYDERVLVKHKK